MPENKSRQLEYLAELKSHLASLPESERQEIIRDQVEYFHDALATGRTELDVIESLGDPKQLAKALIAESRLVATETLMRSAASGTQPGVSAQWKSTLRAVFAIAALAPFNLIFILGPFLVLIGCLLAGWMIGVALLIAGGVAIFFIMTELILISASSWAHASILLFALSAATASLAFLGLMTWASSWIAKLSVKYLRWNLQFIRNQP